MKRLLVLITIAGLLAGCSLSAKDSKRIDATLDVANSISDIVIEPDATKKDQ